MIFVITIKIAHESIRPVDHTRGQIVIIADTREIWFVIPDPVLIILITNFRFIPKDFQMASLKEEPEN